MYILFFVTLSIFYGVSSAALFFPYGAQQGDISLGYGDNLEVPVDLETSFVFWDKLVSRIYVSFNGAIFSEEYNLVNPNVSWKDLNEYSLLVHFANGVASRVVDSKVFVRDSQSREDIKRVGSLLKSRDPDFGPIKSLVIITWINIKFYDSPNESPQLASFQTALVIGDNTTYALLSYEQLGFQTKVKTGFVATHSKFCHFTESLDIMKKMECRSNVNKPGVFLVGLSKNAQVQCGKDNILPVSCSHCIGEETWLHKTCTEKYNASVCDSNNNIYTNQCEFNKAQCRANGMLQEQHCNVCKPNPCGNGECIETGGSYTCRCSEGYTGKNCMVKLNKQSSTIPHVQATFTTTKATKTVTYIKSTTTTSTTTKTTHTITRFDTAKATTSTTRVKAPPTTGLTSTLTVVQQQNMSFNTTLATPIFTKKFQVFQCQFESFPIEENCSPETTGNWYYNQGSTETLYTGPDFDATKGTKDGGYVYFESNLVGDLEKASLYFNLTNTMKARDGCVSFAYHMYGSGMGSLTLRIGKKIFWQKIGGQKNEWHRVNVSITTELKEEFILWFEGQKLLDIYSDMALDDISMYLGEPCPSLNKQSSIESTGQPTITIPSLSTPDRQQRVLYPYGVEQGDKKVAPLDGGKVKISLKRPMILMSSEKQILYISTNGYITTDPFNHTVTTPLLSKNTKEAYIMPFTAKLHSNQRSGEIFWREEFKQMNNTEEFNRINSDIAKIGDGMFTANHVLVISYINIHHFESTNSKKANTFQLILASNNETTYAIFNYKNIEGPGNVGFYETKCNFLNIAHKRNFSSLTDSSNIGVPGRYVYKLTKKECLNKNGNNTSPFSLFTVQLSSNYNHGLLNIKNPLNPNTPRYFFLEPVSEISILFVLREIRDHLKLDFLSTSRLGNININVLAIHDGAEKNSNFQYGSKYFYKINGHIQCSRVKFGVKMTSIPSIKLSSQGSMSMRERYLDYVYTWEQDVSESGFVLCVRAVNSFFPINVSQINYIALVNQTTQTDSKQIQIITNRVLLPQNITCQTISLNKTFINTPQVFVQPEYSGFLKHQGSKNTTSYIKLLNNVNNLKPPSVNIISINDNKVKICATDVSRTGTTLFSFIVYGELNGCELLKCNKYEECIYIKGRKPYCACPENCGDPRDTDGIICGTDGVTYESRCHFKQKQCRANKGNEVDVKHKGRCQNMPFQKGTATLHRISQDSNVFCSNISFYHNRFTHGRTISVYLTVSWPHNIFDKIHHATATWSENINSNGFRACALVSGYHIFGTSIGEPVVQWVAMQKSFVENTHGALERGYADLFPWFAGSQCAVVTVKDQTSSTVVIVTAEHLGKRSLNNAMNVWSERIGDRMIVCARELLTFSGIHAGIRLHWMAVHRSTYPHVIFQDESVSPKNIISKIGNAPSCQTLEMKSRGRNFDFTVLLALSFLNVNNTHQQNQGKKASLYFSNNAGTSWIEQIQDNNLKVCYHTLRTATSSYDMPIVRISPVIFPELCGQGFAYNYGKCYKYIENNQTYNEAEDICKKYNSSLATINGEIQEVFMQQIVQNARIWIKHKNDSRNTSCNIFDGSTKTIAAEECSRRKHRAMCQKDALMDMTACSFVKCLNGGECIEDDKEIARCQCAHGFYGSRCQLAVPAYEECRNYTLHDQPWRNENNSIKYKLSNNFSCDASRLRSGWHRFIGSGGEMLSSKCPGSQNYCGTLRPGWISGTHPRLVGELKTLILQFFSFYCADDSGSVRVRNCGNYFVYNFIDLPYWSCDYGMCTTDSFGLFK